MKYKIIVNDKSIYESYYAVNPNMRILKKGFIISHNGAIVIDRADLQKQSEDICVIFD